MRSNGISGVCYAVVALSALIMGVCAKHAAAAPSGGDAQQTIAKYYSRMDADAARRDVDAELNYCTPSFYEVKPSGKKFTLDELRYNAKTYFESADSVTSHTKIVKFAQHGNQAVVTTNQSEVINGMAGSRRVSIHSVETSKDTWTRTDSGWRMSLSAIVTEHVSVNGRPVAVE